MVPWLATSIANRKLIVSGYIVLILGARQVRSEHKAHSQSWMRRLKLRALDDPCCTGRRVQGEVETLPACGDGDFPAGRCHAAHNHSKSVAQHAPQRQPAPLAGNEWAVDRKEARNVGGRNTRAIVGDDPGILAILFERNHGSRIERVIDEFAQNDSPQHLGLASGLLRQGGGIEEQLPVVAGEQDGGAACPLLALTFGLRTMCPTGYGRFSYR